MCYKTGKNRKNVYGTVKSHDVLKKAVKGGKRWKEKHIFKHERLVASCPGWAMSNSDG